MSTESTSNTPSTSSEETPISLPFNPEDISKALSESISGKGSDATETKTEPVSTATNDPDAGQNKAAEATPETTPNAGEENPEGQAPEEASEIESLLEDDPADGLGLELSPEQEKKILPKRIASSQFDPIEQQAISLRKQMKDMGDEISLKDAIELIEKRHARKAPAETAATPSGEGLQSPADQEAAQPTSIDEEITQLDSQRKDLLKKRAALQRDDPFDDEIAQIDEQLEDVRDQLSDRRAEKKYSERQKKAQESTVQAVQETTRAKAWEESRTAVYKEFPTLNDAGSALSRELNQVIEEVQTPDHPDSGIFHLGNGPRLVVQIAATRLAAKMAEHRGITQEQALTILRGGTTTQKPAKRQAATPAPGNRGTESEPQHQTLSEQELLNAIGFDPEAIAKAKASAIQGSDKYVINI